MRKDRIVSLIAEPADGDDRDLVPVEGMGTVPLSNGRFPSFFVPDSDLHPPA